MSQEQIEDVVEPTKRELPKPQTHEKIVELARWLATDRVFSHYNVPPFSLSMVFIPLTLGALTGMSDEDLERIVVFAVDGVDDTGPFFADGYPTFFSCRIWLKEDFVKAAKMAIKMQEAMEAVTEEKA